MDTCTRCKLDPVQIAGTHHAAAVFSLHHPSIPLLPEPAFLDKDDLKVAVTALLGFRPSKVRYHAVTEVCLQPTNQLLCPLVCLVYKRKPVGVERSDAHAVRQPPSDDVMPAARPTTTQQNTE